jgi:quercetin dioxygenase-like cupin family protein
MPEHDHGASEVILIVRAGRARLIASDGVVTKLEPGAVVTIPVGERVRLENPEDEEARLSVVLTPPDFATAVAAWPAVT